METLFNTGHALPLTSVRFWRPRVSRGLRAGCPRGIRSRALSVGPRSVPDLDVSRPSSRSRAGNDSATIAASALLHPAPDEVRGRGRDWFLNFPQSRIIHVKSPLCPKPKTGSGYAGSPDYPQTSFIITPATIGPHLSQDSDLGGSAYVHVQ